MGKLSTEEIGEIRRLASVWATKRVLKARARAGDLNHISASAEELAKRADYAESEMMAYLESI